MKLTLAEAAIGAGAVLEASSSIPNAGALHATGYSIDSRTIGPGELFFAVRGERLDGHKFIVAAFERGAVAAVVSGVVGSSASSGLRLGQVQTNQIQTGMQASPDQKRLPFPAGSAIISIHSWKVVASRSDPVRSVRNPNRNVITMTRGR